MSVQKNPRPSPQTLRATAIKIGRTLLAKGGPEFVKARDVARGVGVSVGTIYNVFGDLNALLFEINAEVYGELHERVNSAAEQSRANGDALEVQLMTLAKTYLHFVADHPDLWAGVLAFNRRHKAEIPQWYRDRERALFQVLEKTLAPLYAPAKTQEALLAPQALWAAVHGIITVSVGRNGLLATQDEISDQIELIVNSVVTSISVN